MAAPDSSINNYELHYSVNVQGTKNVIDACIECKVKRLVYTSSPSVVFDGIHGLHNADELTPYPEKVLNQWREVGIKSNGQCGLLSCCIRPSSIFGPGDKLLVPSLVAAAKAGKSKLVMEIICMTSLYVENVAHGHICAEKALASEENGTKVAGQAYFITNMEPIKFWDFISGYLLFCSPRTKIPISVIMLVLLRRVTYKIFARYGMRVPQLTPSRIRLLSCNRTFSCSKQAIRSLAINLYIFTVQAVCKFLLLFKEGLKRTIDSYSHLRANKQKKQHLLFNSYKSCFWLFCIISLCPGHTFLTAVAKIFSVIAFFLFIHSKLLQKSTRSKDPPFLFHISHQDMAHRAAISICSCWKLSGWWFPLAFVVFFAYEKWEEEIDSILLNIVSFRSRLKLNTMNEISRQ
ncbi:unnamed protein product [Spirodela intermedia]|uniref:3-beta hydroxysteroid dehydrogenase/isomerase domain-containing protein n=1 Tax=Spirodela intermedia TaxID=51605 RepID=A0A7I8IUV6_SPIIN|nr:unnamed protein product [Spirodela intermedia]CAA6661539.1 unnamed protein product [Spirodela intermedia]